MADDRMYFCHPATGYAVLIAKMSVMDWSTMIASEAVSTLQNWLCNNSSQEIRDLYWSYYDRDLPDAKDPFTLLFEGMTKEHGLGQSWEFDRSTPDVIVEGVQIFKVILHPKRAGLGKENKDE